MKPGISLLVSFAFVLKQADKWLRIMERTQHEINWMIDSGAYSVSQKGAPIDLDAYSRFCRWCERIDPYGYIQLDVVRDMETSHTNLDYMRQLELTPMPVLTADAPIEHIITLRQYHDRICVAGGATAHSDDRQDWYIRRLNESYDLLKGDCLLHGLGYTRGTVPAARSRARTVDSSTWCVGTRYGRILIFDPIKGTCNQVASGDVRHRSWASQPAFVRERVIASGITLEEFDKLKSARHQTISFLSIISANEHLRYCAYMRERGVEVFTAVGSMSHIQMISFALRHGLPSGGVEWKAIRNRVHRVQDPMSLSLELVEASKMFTERIDNERRSRLLHAHL
jgi:hypothetical protein